MSSKPLAYMHAVALRLMALEASGARWMVHTSFCDADGSTYVALIKPAGWNGSAMGVPVTGGSLLECLDRAERATREAGRDGG